MKFLKNWIEDILIISGVAVIVATTFLLSTIAGLYCLGSALFGIGVWLARHLGGGKA